LNFIANSALSFIRPGEEGSFHSFFLVENIRFICGEENKQNRDNLSNFLTNTTQFSEKLKNRTLETKAQPNVTTALMLFMRADYFFG